MDIKREIIFPLAILGALLLPACEETPTPGSPTPPPTTTPQVETPSVPPTTTPPNPGPTTPPEAPGPGEPCPDRGRDYDGDGYACSIDCNERDPDIHPGIPETCDGTDEDCDGQIDNGFPSGCLDVDADGDGVTLGEGDCDDGDPDVAPGRPEVCDGADTNCDGQVDNLSEPITLYPDLDGDGCGTLQGQFTATRCDFPSVVLVACDCDDSDPDANGASPELCADETDNDCDGHVDEGFLPDCQIDADGDGHPAGEDCDDDDPLSNAGALERCDDRDNDCDGEVDEAFPDGCPTDPRSDTDGDGYSPYQGDCDDADATIHPGALELCDGADNDCDLAVDESCDPLSEDEDGDGFSPLQGDCDDTDPAIHPGAAEVCDGLDNDCQGGADEGLGRTCLSGDLDQDDDGYDRPEDCRDTDPDIHPGADERCDRVDEDCDGLTDEGSPAICDQDGDGYSPVDGDCDDYDPSAHPGATELCDVADNDCDLSVDEYCGGGEEPDYDLDGFIPPDDCNNRDSSVYPGAPELCDNKDNDCDDTRDEGCDPGDVDEDDDGYPPSEDCDDHDASTNPGAPEQCDTTDHDCDGAVDEGLVGCDLSCELLAPETCDNKDNDGDLIVDEGCYFHLVTVVDVDSDCVAAYADCDDLDPQTYPQDDDLCGNGVDNDCDGKVDEGCPTEHAWDFDGDGFLGAAYTSGPDADCDDLDASTYPGAPETCDRRDNDCDQLADEDLAGCDLTDADGDGIDRPADCDDTRPEVGPGAPEVCDCADGDCDGLIDEGIEDCTCSPTSLPDRDQDGYTIGDGDCNDLDSSVNPGQAELCDDLRDNDCDGQADETCYDCEAGGPADSDFDGLSVCEGDCDDTDGATGPASVEICDAKDNDCDGVADESLTGRCELTDGPGEDYDGDGHSIDDGDCNDLDSSIYPGAEERCDHKDNDCDLDVDEGLDGCEPPLTVDVDLDTWSPYAGDCNDHDDQIHPGAPDGCDRRDNDCDGDVDEDHVGPCPEPPHPPADFDHDGFTTSEGDCDDRDASSWPGAPELCDSQDNDCDGQADEGAPEPCDGSVDDDGDGLSEDEGDCDDGDPQTHPGAPELCDNKDNDCDGLPEDPQSCGDPVDPDADGDGWTVGEGDCDDLAPQIHPGAEDVCDYIDNDCDGVIDPGFDSHCRDIDDLDQDGFTVAQGDCNDLDEAVNPAAIEVCDGRDNDCDGTSDDDITPPCWEDEPPDEDGDGVPRGPDCDDTDPEMAPGLDEVCDRKDNDCDGQADEDLGDSCRPDPPLVDLDGDGVTVGQGDCDDLNSSTYPGAPELCDRGDNDCDQIADEGLEGQCPGSDACGEGEVLQEDCDPTDDYETTPVAVCVPSLDGDLDCDGFSIADGDCDDDDPDTNPGIDVEACDLKDNNCDGEVDEGLGDSCPFGSPGGEDPDGDGFTQLGGDCDNYDATRYPDAPELCDLKDNDCDGTADEGLDVDCGAGPGDDPDVDHDGDGQTINQGDCDDTDPETYLGAVEQCDGRDNDCDGAPEEPGCHGTPSVVDQDGDGYTLDEGDCDDLDASAFPGAPERCNSDDDDCDGEADEGVPLCDRDQDLDGDGLTPEEGDCDDTDATIFPGAEETCDREDEDCDGIADEGTTEECGYPDDHDHDYDGYTQFEGDCDDQDSTVHPGADELCDLQDNDCDGTADEALGDTCDTQGSSDADGDGVTVGEGDCDDLFADTHPGHEELCDDRDNDCDGFADEGVEALCPFAPADPTDYDEDGYTLAEGDCDDWDAASNPGQAEICDDRDNDCDGVADDGLSCDHGEDDDGDGYSVDEGDCDDHDPRVNGQGPETCDQVDNDCDGQADEELPWCGYGTDQDADHDGWTILEGDCDDLDSASYPGAQESCDRDDNDCDGVADEGLTSCPEDPSQDEDHDDVSILDGDCDDTDPLTYPGAPERCDKADNDCDGVADEGFAPDCEAAGPTAYDRDADGWTVGEGDCNDLDASVNPAMPDICDGRDNDCTGASDDDPSIPCPSGADDDGDGVPVPLDCDDHDADVGSDDPEICDGLDNDCNGVADDGLDGCGDPTDLDRDHDSYTVGEGDCDDTDPSVHPNAVELCDRQDNDCDITVDEDVVEPCPPGTGGYDADGDHFTPDGGDCDDTDPNTHPYAPETCDYADDDCDGAVDEDLNGCPPPPGESPDDDDDGVTIDEGDCDDQDPDVYPGAPEPCDLKDNDCDGAHDESPVTSCDQDGDGYSVWDGDCDDLSPSVHPDAEELCNGIDDNCNGPIDEGATGPCDVDQDGYYAPGLGVSPLQRDCDDHDPATYLGAEEICDRKDNDCDRSIDEETAEACDYDGDGFVSSGDCQDYSQDPVENPGTEYCDCSPFDGDTYPGAFEICDMLDNDCDEIADETWLTYSEGGIDFGDCPYLWDNDEDGHYLIVVDEDGDPVLDDDGNPTFDDCNDTDPTVYLGAEELCDLKDNDCDRIIDEGEWDVDETYGDQILELLCELDPELCPEGEDTQLVRCSDDYDGDTFPSFEEGEDGLPVLVDCNDLDPLIYSGAPERCDLADNDCDRLIDEGFYTCNDDFDGDGFGIDQGDCDDDDPTVYPGALETCDRKDNDCDGKVGDRDDNDGDGYTPCTGDCNDTDAGIHSLMEEQWYWLDDYKDADCDGELNPPPCDKTKPIPIIDVEISPACTISQQEGRHVDLETFIHDFCDADCEVSPSVVFEVRNHGTDGSPAGLKASIFGERADGTYAFLTETTLPPIQAGKSSGRIEVVTTDYIPELYEFKAIVVTADHYNGAPATGDLRECDETNNRAQGFVHHVECPIPLCDLPVAVPGYQVTEADESCRFEPPVGTFNAKVKWNVGSSQPFPTYPSNKYIRSALVAGNLTDDNCDGRIDDRDVPDIATATYGSGPGVLRILSGDDGHQIASYQGIAQLHGVALADADADGRPEVYTANTSSDLIRLNLNPNGCGPGVTGTLVHQWTADTNARSDGYPAVGDIDGDGDGEIVHGTAVVDHNGRIISRLALNHYWTPFFADVNQDGYMEVVSGAGVSRAMDGTTVWAGKGQDGALADMDGDGRPELVGVNPSASKVTLHDDDGRVLWQVDMPGGRGGPPTIADFDNDGQLEIGISGYNRYIVLETDGSVLWQFTIEDWSSGCTGSSVFDFEGDGRAEVLQADHQNVWVFDGRRLGYPGSDAGRVLLQDPGHASLTRREYPLVLDVDRDGHAEMVVAEDAIAWSGRTGVTVLEDQNNYWVSGLPVWNQHAFHITNINNDMSVPRREEPHWLKVPGGRGNNTFRQGGASDRDRAQAAPDLRIATDSGNIAEDGDPEQLSICQDTCPAYARVLFTIENWGANTVAPGLAWSLYGVNGGSRTFLRSGTVNVSIPAGETAPTQEVQVSQSEMNAYGRFVIKADDNNGVGVQNECDEANNELELSVQCF